MRIHEWGKRLFPRGHIYRLWTELIEQFIQQITTAMNPTKHQVLNWLDVIDELKVLEPVISELYFTYNSTDQVIVVYYKKEHFGHLTIDVDKEIVYIENVHYYKSESMTKAPIKGVSVITLEDFIIQIIDPDDIDLKYKFEKAVFSLT